MFQPAGHWKKHLKIILYGEANVGKTTFALRAPGKKAVIDTGNETDFYNHVYSFDVKKTQNISELMQSLDEIERNPNQYDILIIDPITNIYQALKDTAWKFAEQRAIKKEIDPESVMLTQRDWGQIKQKYTSLISRLTRLPCHVIVTGWQKDIYDEKSMKRIGTRIESDKKTNHLADVVIRLECDRYGNRLGIIEKDRTMTFRLGERVKNISFDHFVPALSNDEQESTLSQQRQIYILGNKRGLNNDQVKEYASEVFDISVTSLKQLNYGQAEELKQKVEQMKVDVERQSS